MDMNIDVYKYSFMYLSVMGSDEARKWFDRT